MVVIPTIISDKDKIKTMFDQLESFYIMNNKTDNLYFTLLGDVKSSSKEVEDYDVFSFYIYHNMYIYNYFGVNKELKQEIFKTNTKEELINLLDNYLKEYKKN